MDEPTQCSAMLGPGISCELPDGHTGLHRCAASGNLINIEWSELGPVPEVWP